MKIAGRRTGETYPEAPRSSSSGGGGILGIGEVTNTFISIDGGVGAVDIPGLEIDFADWTPGDVLLVEYWCGAIQNPEVAVDVIYSVIPVFDVGAGFAQLDSSGFQGIAALTLGADTVGFQLSSSVSVACPVAPKVKLQGGSAGGTIIVQDRSCVLRAYRTPASLFITGPAGVLPP